MLGPLIGPCIFPSLAVTAVTALFCLSLSSTQLLGDSNYFLSPSPQSSAQGLAETNGVLMGWGRGRIYLGSLGVRSGASSRHQRGLDGDLGVLGLAPTEGEDVGGFLPWPEGTLCHPGVSAEGWGLRPHAVQRRSILGGGCWLYDGALISPSHSSFFMTSEVQKQKLFTLRLKLFMTCAEEMSSTAFCLGLTWGTCQEVLLSLFRCHFCLYNPAPWKSFTRQCFCSSKAVILSVLPQPAELLCDTQHGMGCHHTRARWGACRGEGTLG